MSGLYRLVFKQCFAFVSVSLSTLWHLSSSRDHNDSGVWDLPLYSKRIDAVRSLLTSLHTAVLTSTRGVASLVPNDCESALWGIKFSGSTFWTLGYFVKFDLKLNDYYLLKEVYLYFSNCHFEFFKKRKNDKEFSVFLLTKISYFITY